MAKNNLPAIEFTAVARAKDLPISTKQSMELSRSLRYTSTGYAKKFLQEVVAQRKAVPFVRFNRDTGHKAGMAAGRFPQKAAQHFLKLIQSVEANAQVKGLDAGQLKIVKILANKASVPFTGSRLRRKTKRTHLEVMVLDVTGKKKEQKDKKAVSAVEAEKKEFNATKEETSQNKPRVDQLLQQAQAKAAELKQQEKESKDTKQVENLYEELHKKGTLRSKSK